MVLFEIKNELFFFAIEMDYAISSCIFGFNSVQTFISKAEEIRIAMYTV